MNLSGLWVIYYDAVILQWTMERLYPYSYRILLILHGYASNRLGNTSYILKQYLGYAWQWYFHPFWRVLELAVYEVFKKILLGNFRVTGFGQFKNSQKSVQCNYGCLYKHLKSERFEGFYFNLPFLLLSEKHNYNTNNLPYFFFLIFVSLEVPSDGYFLQEMSFLKFMFGLMW